MPATRKQILNPETGRMVFIDGKVGKSILQKQKENLILSQLPVLNDDVMRKISDISNVHTRETLRQTTKALSRHIPRSISTADKTALIIEMIIDDMLNYQIRYSISLITAKYYITISFNKSKLVFIKTLYNERSELPKVIISVPNPIRNLERPFKLQQLVAYMKGAKRPVKATIQEAINNLESLSFSNSTTITKWSMNVHKLQDFKDIRQYYRFIR